MIPSRNCSPAKELLLVSGHTHQVRRGDADAGWKAGGGLVVGAACGSWWRGFKDAAGIPDALMNCGSPRGYFVCDFRKSGYSLAYQRIGVPAEAIDSTAVTPGTFASLGTVSDGRLAVNVYGGSKEGTVRIRSGSRTLTLERVSTTAPSPGADRLQPIHDPRIPPRPPGSLHPFAQTRFPARLGHPGRAKRSLGPRRPDHRHLPRPPDDLLTTLLLCIFTLNGCRQGPTLAGHVDPMIGTAYNGHVFPGATVPFGMVSPSPDTGLNDWKHCAGYHYDDDSSWASPKRT